MNKELTDIVGRDRILDASEILDAYSKDISFTRPMKPTCVVKVNTTDEVQEIVRWANQTQTPIIPVSSGPPHSKGDTVPSVPEAVIIDLSGMNRILGINRLHRMVYIEPGVTYGQLQEALAIEGMTLSTSLAPRMSKSVLTSVLEIEPRLNPRHQWSYMDPLRCLGVIWGDGNRMFTGEAGMGALDLEKQWKSDRWQVLGSGPGQFDFFRLLTAAQGTMGIVTWASLKCEILPQIHRLYFVSARKINSLMDFVYRILRLRFADELMIVNHFYLACLLGRSPENIKELRDELPSWMVLIGIAGRNLLPQERVETQEQDISEIAQQFGLKMVPSVAGAKGIDTLKILINPSSEPYWKLRYKGSFQDIFFITTLDRTPDFINRMYELAEEFNYSNSEIGVYIQPQHAGTSCHCEFYLVYDSEKEEEKSRLYHFYCRASLELSNLGAFYSRPYGIWSRLQLNKDAQTTMTLKRLKAIFDPNTIMNPGKLCNY